MATVSETATPTNPTAYAPNGIGGFFAYLGGLAGQVVQGVASNRLAESTARSNARVQSILNQNHALNPSTGANDPNAAQNAANRSFLERFLPSSMLYNTSVAEGGSV